MATFKTNVKEEIFEYLLSKLKTKREEIQHNDFTKIHRRFAYSER